MWGSELQLSLMDESGNTKDDLGLPKGTDDAEKLASQIQGDFHEGKELVVTVLKVCPCLIGAFPLSQPSYTSACSIQRSKDSHNLLNVLMV